MTGLYLLDKSALARVVASPTVQAALERLDDIGTLATTAVVNLEIGYGARNLAEFDSMATDRAELYQDLPLAPAVSARVRYVQRELARRGHRRGPGVPELLIAAAGEMYGAVLVHYDRDFDTIAAVTGQPVEWIVPPGSVP